MTNEIWYSVCVHDAGYIEQTVDGYGFNADVELCAPRLQRDLARKAVEVNGSLFLSTEILSSLIDTRGMVGTYLKFGRRKMWKATEELLLEAMERNAYPRRSEREEQVQRRNADLIDWLSKFV